MEEALKSTLCFDKGSSFIVDAKLFVFGVCIYLFIPPHCRYASIWHHPISPKTEAASKAAASLQRGQLNKCTWAQLQQQEDASKGGDNGHAAEHSNGDGEPGGQLKLQSWVPLAHHEATRRLPHVLVEVQAGARDGVQGAVRGARQAGPRAEATAGQAGRWAGQAGWDGSWWYRVSHCVVEGLGAHWEACWTLVYTALLKEVVTRVAFWNTEKQSWDNQQGVPFYLFIWVRQLKKGTRIPAQIIKSQRAQLTQKDTLHLTFLYWYIHGFFIS